MRTRSILALFIVVMALPSAHANVPNQFSVQGVLRDSAGKLQSMMVNVTVTLYDAQAQGNKLAGPYGPMPVIATNGLFTFPIQDPMIQTELGTASQVWLEIAVGNDTFARQLVTPQMFALVCGTADLAKGLPGVTVANGNVGIGTTTPKGALEVDQKEGENLLQMRNSSNGGSWAIRLQGDSTTSNNFHIDSPGPPGQAAPVPDVLTIRAGGNVGIGTATALSTLHISGANSSFRIGPNLNGYAFDVDDADGFKLKVHYKNPTSVYREIMTLDYSNGNVGIGTTAPDNLLTVNGSADKPGGGSWGSFSDERLKDIKGPFRAGLKEVMQLKPVRYEYKSDNALGIVAPGEHVGFSAQAVERVVPEAVSKNAKGYRLVNNDPILWSMLNAMKEQQQEIADLRARLKRLEARLEQRARR